MKIAKITYQKAFQIGPFLQEKIGVEIELSDTDDPEKAFQLAKEMTEDFHKQANPHLEEGAPIQGTPPPPREIQVERPKDRIEAIIADIQTCTDIVVVDSYRLIAKSHPAIAEAFDKKMLELTNNDWHTTYDRK